MGISKKNASADVDQKPLEKKPSEKKPDDKKPKYKGVKLVNLDKNLVMVKGIMASKEMVPYLKEKLKQNVEAVQPKKDDDKNYKQIKRKQQTSTNNHI